MIYILIKGVFFKSEKDTLYYLNLANLHALIGKLGKLKS